MDTPSGIDPEERAACLRILQQIADEPSAIDGDERMKALVAKIHKAGKKGERRAERSRQQAEDRALRSETAMVQRDLRRQPLAAEAAPAEGVGVLRRPAHCYICKERYTGLHAFYHQLCPRCAALNYHRRGQRADLTGRTALLTGGRIKIGFQTALRMLRDGARVIVTTRFPADALRRYAAEPDAGEWLGRLRIAALDLRNLPKVEAFAGTLFETEPHLEILINNAAQTLKRPQAFYQPLLEAETAPPVLLEALFGYHDPSTAALLALRVGEPSALVAYFPPDLRDADGQPVDPRPINSWFLRRDEVSTLEMLEVQLVNAVAPFLLCSRLKPLFLRSPFTRRFIVNVSAMEGQFGRGAKSDCHPHTNMAKAGLNMLTRTPTRLWLKRNPIGLEGAGHVARLLRRTTTLRALDLVNTGIGAEGLALVIDALTEANRSVERLYVGGNALGSESAPGIAELLRRNSTIRALYLNANPLGDPGVGWLTQALRENQSVEERALASCGLTAASAEAMFGCDERFAR
jgi:NAD(P)-dependent dehydrogenase (short-subunit alcohol dehydrogenase family)